MRMIQLNETIHAFGFYLNLTVAAVVLDSVTRENIQGLKVKGPRRVADLCNCQKEVFAHFENLTRDPNVSRLHLYQ